MLKCPLEIIPNVYQLSIRATNIILIAEEELTLIDTGLPGSSTRITDFIHSLGRSVEEVNLIIITHNHFDQAGGLAELKKLIKAKVAVHKADITSNEEHLPYPGVIRRLLQRLLQRLLRNPLFYTLRSTLLLKPSDVDIPLAGGEVLKPLGGLEVIHTPGHTPGSISLFSPKNKLLLIGDALNKHRKTLRLPPKMASTDLTQAIESIKEMARLDVDILCLGHGRPLTEDVHSKMQDLIKK
ncbi:MBL fold metallo-hydrolase [Chloroflexota bacterium]